MHTADRALLERVGITPEIEEEYARTRSVFDQMGGSGSIGVGALVDLLRRLDIAGPKKAPPPKRVQDCPKGTPVVVKNEAGEWRGTYCGVIDFCHGSVEDENGAQHCVDFKDVSVAPPDEFNKGDAVLVDIEGDEVQTTVESVKDDMVRVRVGGKFRSFPVEKVKRG